MVMFSITPDSSMVRIVTPECGWRPNVGMLGLWIGDDRCSRNTKGFTSAIGWFVPAPLKSVEPIARTSMPLIVLGTIRIVYFSALGLYITDLFRLGDL
mmetsp:Transcript_284/g.334  ORF Transcript_284/g.334 Transcript_284/m.334 type:complete len:98 (-) Transcript_284:68-361(-)